MKKLLLSTAVLLALSSQSFAGEHDEDMRAQEPAPQVRVMAESKAEDAQIAPEVQATSEQAAPEKVEMASEIQAAMHEEIPPNSETQTEKGEPPHAETHHEITHWGYTGTDSAPHWGDLDEKYHICKDGQSQSPINIAKFLQEDVPDLKMAYHAVPLSVTNNGHTVQVNIAPGSSFEVGGITYDFLQLHFHTPSEHYLDGAPYPMEAHFVHKASDGTLGVIGVMMKVGEHNPVIEGIWQNVPAAGETKIVETVEINPGDLLPSSLDYYKYDGSLTTPPCSEGVQWHVLKNTIELSEKQLRAFQSAFPVNARSIQPLNERVITGD